MHRHRTSRYRALRPGARGPARWLRLQQRGGLFLLVLVGLVTAALLAYAPSYYRLDQLNEGRAIYSDVHWADFEAVERHWKYLPILQTVKRGDEPEVQRFLADQPLVVALLDRFEGRHLWLREGDRLVPPQGDPSLFQQYLGWFSHAEMAQRFEWNPPKEQDPDSGKIATVVLLSDRWLVLKRWRPGSPAVERELDIALAPNHSLRMGLIRNSDLDRTDLVAQPWGAEPHLQVDPRGLTTLPLGATVQTNAYGDGWSLGGVGFEVEQQGFRRLLKHRYWAASGISALVALALFLGLWLRRQARRKAVLNGDRLASMTHSLKTPLAILKFRCDSLRLGRLSPERADEELLRISEEVDHLAALIETSLRVIRGGNPSEPCGQATQSWFQEVVEDLRPGFELEKRPLDLRLAKEAAHAPLPPLRAAVFTLMENALSHGQGRVTLATWRHRRRFCIQISDEGEGLEPHQLKSLGKPFQRLREQGKEGFQRPGQGLGLSLLVQMAEQEGWGLTFASAPGEGFSALLEVPAA